MKRERHSAALLLRPLLLILLVSLLWMPARAAYKLSAPTLTAAKLTPTGITLEWKPVSGSPAYQVMLKTNDGNWKAAGVTTDCSYTVVNLPSGNTYALSVRCWSSTKKQPLSSYDPVGKALRFYRPPILVSAKNGENGVTVTWKKSGGVKYCKVFYIDSRKSWHSAGITSSTSCLIKGLRPDADYSFAVRCMDVDKRTFLSASPKEYLRIHTWLSAPKITAVNLTTTGLQVNWEKVSWAPKYLVQYQGSDGVWKTAGMTDQNSFTVTGLKANQNYYFSVRCMNRSGRSILSPKSKTESATWYTGPLKNNRYAVSSTPYHLNQYNLLGYYGTLAQAKKAIASQSAATRDQWFVYDRADGMKVVYPDLSTRSKRVAKLVAWAMAISEDRRHGYSCVGEDSDNSVDIRLERWGLYGDYSCSTFASMAYELAGIVNLREVTKANHLVCRANGGTYQDSLNCTSIVQACRLSGKLVEVTDQFSRQGNSALQPGDLLVTGRQRHVAIYIGGGRVAEAAMNELGREFAKPTPGDQRGSEICISSGTGSFYYAFRAK